MKKGVLISQFYSQPILNSEKGFTLLEVLIAIAIMLVAFTAIFMVESGSIKATERAREMNTVSMLAKNAMIEAEFDYEGKGFDEVKKELSGTFPSPFENYSWTRVIKEIEFPSMNMGGGGKEGKEAKSSDTGTEAGTEMMTKLVTQYLSKAAREVTITISWQRGGGKLEYSVSTYWVDLNHEFQITQ